MVIQGSICIRQHRNNYYFNTFFYSSQLTIFCINGIYFCYGLTYITSRRFEHNTHIPGRAMVTGIWQLVTSMLYFPKVIWAVTASNVAIPLWRYWKRQRVSFSQISIGQDQGYNDCYWSLCHSLFDIDWCLSDDIQKSQETQESEKVSGCQLS